MTTPKRARETEDNVESARELALMRIIRDDPECAWRALRDSPEEMIKLYLRMMRVLSPPDPMSTIPLLSLWTEINKRMQAYVAAHVRTFHGEFRKSWWVRTDTKKIFTTPHTAHDIPVIYFVFFPPGTLDMLSTVCRITLEPQNTGVKILLEAPLRRSEGVREFPDALVAPKDVDALVVHVTEDEHFDALEEFVQSIVGFFIGPMGLALEEFFVTNPGYQRKDEMGEP